MEIGKSQIRKSQHTWPDVIRSQAETRIAHRSCAGASPVQRPLEKSAPARFEGAQL
jgi:hypothetical protein